MTLVRLSDGAGGREGQSIMGDAPRDARIPALRVLTALIAFVNREMRFYRLMMNDSRTPTSSKILIGAAVGYAIWPLGLVPDFIPIVGYVDDVIIVPALVYIAVRRVPREVVTECRRQAAERGAV